MLYQAITTKYFGPSNVRGSRVKATAEAGSVTLSYDCSLNADANHAKAAETLARKYGWRGFWFSGGLPGGKGNVFVCAHDFTMKDLKPEGKAALTYYSTFSIEGA